MTPLNFQEIHYSKCEGRSKFSVFICMTSYATNENKQVWWYKDVQWMMAVFSVVGQLTWITKSFNVLNLTNTACIKLSYKESHDFFCIHTIIILNGNNLSYKFNTVN